MPRKESGAHMIRRASRFQGGTRSWFLLAALAVVPCECGGGSDTETGPFSVRPSLLDLGAIGVGLTDRTTLVLRNSGEGVLAILDAHPSENLERELELVGVPAALPPRAEAEVGVVFTPIVRGPREGEIVFATGSGRSPEVRVRVVGVALDRKLVARPGSLDFGRVLLGSSRSSVVVIANGGDAPVTIDKITVDLETTSEIEASLASIRKLGPGEEFTTIVRYAPTDIGLDEGRVLIGDDTSGPSRLGIAVRGEGILSEIEVDPVEIRFLGLFTGERKTRFFDVRNLGAASHTITSIALETSSSSELLIESSTLTRVPFELAPGSERRVHVTYAPNDDIADTDRVRIDVAGLSTPHFVSLAGEALRAPVPVIEVSPLSLTFGAVQVGADSSRTLRIRNVGDADLHIVSDVAVVPTVPHARLTDVVFAGTTLPPFDCQTLTVVVAPLALGPLPRAGVLIQSDDPVRPQIAVPIQGEGVEDAIADLEADPSPLDFGRVPRGTRARRTLLLQNSGSRALELLGVELTDDGEGRYALGPDPGLPRTLAPREFAKIAIEYFDPLGPAAARLGSARLVSTDPDEDTIDVVLRAETLPSFGGLPEIAVDLAWGAAGADLDLHLIRPGGGAYYDAPSDCCYCNANPDWGRIADPADDPFLDRDDVDGPGVERIALAEAAPGEYQIAVHAFGGGGSAVTLAEVTVRSGGDSLGTFTRALAGGQRWDVGTVVWDGFSARFEASLSPATSSSRFTCH